MLVRLKHDLDAVLKQLHDTQRHAVSRRQLTVHTDIIERLSCLGPRLVVIGEHTTINTTINFVGSQLPPQTKLVGLLMTIFDPRGGSYIRT